MTESRHPVAVEQDDAEQLALDLRGRKAVDSVAWHTIHAIRSAGFLVVFDRGDDVYRIRWPRELVSSADPVLVGLVTIRDGRIQYAEFRGEVFAWWGHDDTSPEHQWAVEGFLAAIREGARK